MNERFLFRGRRYDNGEWITGWITSQFKKFTEGEVLTYIKSNVFGGGEHLVNTETVGQCTGLKDKNGKLIFEGDIVKNKAWYVIKYENGGYGLSAFGKTKPIPIMGHWNFNSDEIEVIGNIHDNPELLEER